MIYVIDDDEIMAECIARSCGKEAEVKKFSNAIEATAGLEDVKLIFLDVMLDGPDGFTFLNELISYTDTAQIPVVIVTSLDLKNQDLSAYGVVGILDKSTMTPKDIRDYAEKYA